VVLVLRQWYRRMYLSMMNASVSRMPRISQLICLPPADVHFLFASGAHAVNAHRAMEVGQISGSGDSAWKSGLNHRPARASVAGWSPPDRRISYDLKPSDATVVINTSPHRVLRCVVARLTGVENQ
jgi:hypothetical protein